MSKKVRVTVEENVTYKHEIELVQPENVSDEKMEELYDRAEKRAQGGDDVHSMLAQSFNVTKYSTGFPRSPLNVEVEIIDVMDVKE